MKRLLSLFAVLIILSLAILGCDNSIISPAPKNQLYSDITTDKAQYIELFSANDIRYYAEKSSIDFFVDKDKKESLNATIYEIKKDSSSIIKSVIVFTYDSRFSQKALKEKVIKDIETEYDKEKLQLLSKSDFDHLVEQKLAKLQENALNFYAGIKMTKVNTSEYSYDGNIIDYQDKTSPQPIFLNDKSMRYTLAQKLYELKNKTSF